MYQKLRELEPLLEEHGTIGMMFSEFPENLTKTMQNVLQENIYNFVETNLTDDPGSKKCGDTLLQSETQVTYKYFTTTWWQVIFLETFSLHLWCTKPTTFGVSGMKVAPKEQDSLTL